MSDDEKKSNELLSDPASLFGEPSQSSGTYTTSVFITSHIGQDAAVDMSDVKPRKVDNEGQGTTPVDPPQPTLEKHIQASVKAEEKKVLPQRLLKKEAIALPARSFVSQKKVDNASVDSSPQKDKETVGEWQRYIQRSQQGQRYWRDVKNFLHMRSRFFSAITTFFLIGLFLAAGLHFAWSTPAEPDSAQAFPSAAVFKERTATEFNLAGALSEVPLSGLSPIQRAQATPWYEGHLGLEHALVEWVEQVNQLDQNFALLLWIVIPLLFLLLWGGERVWKMGRIYLSDWRWAVSGSVVALLLGITITWEIAGLNYDFTWPEGALGWAQLGFPIFVVSSLLSGGILLRMLRFRGEHQERWFIISVALVAWVLSVLLTFQLELVGWIPLGYGLVLGGLLVWRWWPELQDMWWARQHAVTNELATFSLLKSSPWHNLLLPVENIARQKKLVEVHIGHLPPSQQPLAGRYFPFNDEWLTLVDKPQPLGGMKGILQIHQDGIWQSEENKDQALVEIRLPELEEFDFWKGFFIRMDGYFSFFELEKRVEDSQAQNDARRKAYREWLGTVFAGASHLLSDQRDRWTVEHMERLEGAVLRLTERWEQIEDESHLREIWWEFVHGSSGNK